MLLNEWTQYELKDCINDFCELSSAQHMRCKSPKLAEVDNCTNASVIHALESRFSMKIPIECNISFTPICCHSLMWTVCEKIRSTLWMCEKRLSEISFSFPYMKWCINTVFNIILFTINQNSDVYDNPLSFERVIAYTLKLSNLLYEQNFEIHCQKLKWILFSIDSKSYSTYNPKKISMSFSSSSSNCIVLNII